MHAAMSMLTHRARGLVALLLAAVLVAGLWWRQGAGQEPASRDPVLPAQPVSADGRPAFPPPWSVLPQAPMRETAGAAPTETAEGGDGRPLRFRADATGNLVKDAAARSGIERVAALYPGNQGLARLREAVAALPPAAQQQAEHLYHQWKQYSAAIPQALPPPQDDTPPDDGEIQRQFDVLHRLRATHFGAETAQSMFGEEEQMAQQVLERMRLQADPSLSPAEKAERALRSLPAQKPRQQAQQ